MMRKIFSLLLAVAVFLTVFAACDNSDENPTKKPTREFTLAELSDIGERLSDIFRHGADRVRPR